MNVDLKQHLDELGVDLDKLTTEDILTNAQAARLAGVKPQTVIGWRKRGYIGLDGKRTHLRNIGTEDRPRFLRVDVALAERATRHRAVLRDSELLAVDQFRHRHAA